MPVFPRFHAFSPQVLSAVCFSLFLGASALLWSSPLTAQTQICLEPEAEKAALPIHREILGVNQLFYGKDSYGFLLPGTQTAQPELVETLRQIGIRSMRYPGGCGGTHNYDWKKSIGLKGPYSGLGLLEFLRVCEEIEAEPMLGISAFRGSPEEAAEFVEFLNAPNDGNHPWAALRAKLGHPAPYAVRYIEYGNESYHGNHTENPTRGITAAEYGRNYLKFREAMKKADPRIQLGLVLGPRYWNRGVWEVTGSEFDFGIVHRYQSVRQVGAEEYILNFRAMELLETQKNDALEDCPAEKRGSIRLALTEFNTNMTQHKHLTAALVNAETLFFLCRNPNYFAAQYWQFLNEGFGMVRGKTGNFVKRPNALMFELFSSILQERYLPAIHSGRYVSVTLLSGTSDEIGPDGKPVQRKELTNADTQKDLLGKPNWKADANRERTTLEVLPDGSLKIRFLTDEAFNFYHVSAWRSVPLWKSVKFRVTAEIRVEGMEDSSGIALELGDGRGFTKTRSVSATESVFVGDWTPVSADYYPLKDTKSLELKVRRFNGGGRGTAYIRNIKIVPVLPEERTGPAVSHLLTVSRDGKRLGLLLVNRSFEPETVTFDCSALPAFAKEASLRVSARVLTASDPYADNESDEPKVRILPLEVQTDGTQIRLTVPPHSLAGLTAELPQGQKEDGNQK